MEEYMGKNKNCILRFYNRLSANKSNNPEIEQETKPYKPINIYLHKTFGLQNKTIVNEN